MAISCPTHDKKWKRFLKEVGSLEEAMKQWLTNGRKIPEVQETIFKSRNKGFSIVTKNNNILIDEYKQQRFNNIRRIKESKDDTLNDSLRFENLQLEDKIANLKEQNDRIQIISDQRDILVIGFDQIREINDIVSNPMIDLKSINRYAVTIKLWKDVTDTAPNHILFSDSIMKAMLKNEEFRADMGKLRIEADILHNKMAELGESLMETEIMNTYLEKSIKEEAIKQFKKMVKTGIKDIGNIHSLFLDISETDNALFKVISALLDKSDFEEHLEADELFEKSNKLLSSLTSEEKDLFHQRMSNRDSRETGNFTYRYTQEFFGLVERIKSKLRRAEKQADNISNKSTREEKHNKNYEQMLDDYSKVVYVLDPNILFESEVSGEVVTPEEKENHIRLLKNSLGERGYTFAYNEAKKKLDQFKLDSKAIKKYYEDKNPDEAERLFNYWKMNHSPFFNALWINKGVGSVNRLSPRPNFTYTEMVPKNDNHYDDRFKQIENNDRLLEIHNFLIDTFRQLTSYLPSDKTSLVQINSFPELRKEIVETFMEDGALKTMYSLWDRIKESTRTDDLSSTIDSVALEVTGKPNKSFQFPLLHTNKTEVDNYINSKIIEYRTAQSRGLNTLDSEKKRIRKQEIEEEITDLIPEWKADITSAIAQRKSWDISKVLQAYGIMAITYKHRSKIEDPLRMIDSIMDKVKENFINPAGTPTKNSSGDIMAKQGLENMMKSWDYYKDLYFGYPSKAPEGQTSTKVLNSQELEVKKGYEAQIEKVDEAFDKGDITQQEWQDSLTTLYKQMEELGGYRTWSAIGDDLMAYLQLKGIGWNIFSGFSNLGFGFVCNITEASDGRRFNMKDFFRASTILLHSVGRSVSMGIYEDDLSRKVHNLMQRLDTLKESRYEIFTKKKANLKSGLQSLMPYNLQQRSEFMNQGTVMVAMLLHKKVTVNGKETTLWDAYDAEGKLPEGMTDIEINTKASIDETIRDIHGNYDNLHHPIRAKKVFLGRAFIQFKTWAIMGFHNRFSGDNPSYNTGLIRRGRYRSYAKFFSDLGPIQGTFEVTKQLLRKLMFMNTNFDKLGDKYEFDETDAANMRKNLTEIVILMNLFGLGIVLKGLTAGDRDEPEFKYAAMFTLNMMNRLSVDILFYSSPTQFMKLNKNALPLFSLVTDAAKLTAHMGNLITGGSDLYSTGIYAGESKTWHYTRGMVPFLTTWNRITAQSQQQIWKNR